MNNNTALQKRNQNNAPAGLSLVPERNSLARLSMRDLKEFAEICVASGQFPDIKSLAQAQIKILAGQELGFSPIVSMTGIHFFQGKIEFSATLKASLIKDSGKYDYKVLEHTKDACEIAFFRRNGDEWISCGVPVRYTMADAQAAGLANKDNWKKHPMDMLFAAVIRQGTRRHCADVLRGVSSDEDHEVETAADASALGDAAATSPVIDAETVSDIETVRDQIAAVCRDLNAGGDDIKWTTATLREYADNFNGKPYEEQNDEEVAYLADHLKERLEGIRAAKNEIDRQLD